MTILLTLAVYIVCLLLYSRFMTGKGGNEAFYKGNRRSPWYMVAFGMVGASISGVTFVSVPGMVNSIGMTYMQTCLGFIFGYLIVAFVLLPIYYRLDLTTIYSYLDRQLGHGAYTTGAWFFLLSKMAGAAIRFYIVCFILQRYVFNGLGIPFPLTVITLVFLIWLYTRRGGIKTLVWTDSFQTACMLLALCFIMYKVVGALDMTFPEAFNAVCEDKRSQWFVFDDAFSRQYFWKQFLSGVFIVIVMTGLDQDMMQKNLTCKSLRDAQKDICCYGLAFVPANLLFLSLGVLLSLLCAKEGLPLPQGDALLPEFAASGRLGEAVVVFFTIGIVAAALSSADSALTAMTTTFCVDIMRKSSDEALRKRVHILLAVVFALTIIAVSASGSTSMIDAIYTLCGYTYGPLLGLFAFAWSQQRFRPMAVRVLEDKGMSVAAATIVSPVVCMLLEHVAASQWNYNFGYEMLLINGFLVYTTLCIIRKV